jgi:Mor family transcriptional regulator
MLTVRTEAPPDYDPAEIDRKELPDLYQEMADLVGMACTLVLAGHFAGSSLYFPKLERTMLRRRNRQIRSEFKDGNLRDLSRRWGLSTRHLRQIINRHD